MNGVKGPLLLRFNYFNEVPANFIVEISYNERIAPIEETYRCPEKIVFAPEINKDYFPKSHIYIRTTAATRTIKFKLTARFPK